MIDYSRHKFNAMSLVHKIDRPIYCIKTLQHAILRCLIYLAFERKKEGKIMELIRTLNR